MSGRRVRVVCTVAAAALALSGCMFKMKHQLPPKTYFGSLPAAPGEARVAFEYGGMKNWALAGLLPYSRWGTGSLLVPSTKVARRENLEIETRFGVLDTVIWVVPGFFYGYYVWAPRSLRVSGDEITTNGSGK